MTRYVSDSLRIMRLALGRRNENDPDSSDSTLLAYLNDFVSITMPNDIKLFEQKGTLIFDIDGSTGTYTFNDVGADSNFSNISQEGFISLKDPEGESLSWNKLRIYQDPSSFYQKWGVNNEDILTVGYPTDMLYNGDTMVFRTIPDDTYTVYIFGYKISPDFSEEGNPELPFDRWLRYLAYGAAVNYARDYRFDQESLALLERNFAREREVLATNTFNQAKLSRCQPRF